MEAKNFTPYNKLGYRTKKTILYEFLIFKNNVIIYYLRNVTKTM